MQWPHNRHAIFPIHWSNRSHTVLNVYIYIHTHTHTHTHTYIYIYIHLASKLYHSYIKNHSCYTCFVIKQKNQLHLFSEKCFHYFSVYFQLNWTIQEMSVESLREIVPRGNLFICIVVHKYYKRKATVTKGGTSSFRGKLNSTPG